MITITFCDGGTATFSDCTTLGRMSEYLRGRYVLHYCGDGRYTAEPVARRAEVYDFAGSRRVSYTLPALVQEQAS